MEKMWFRGYGFLDWLSPEAYYTDKWKYLHYAFGSDEVQYDIVEKDGEYRYTNIQEIKMETVKFYIFVYTDNIIDPTHQFYKKLDMLLKEKL